MNKFILLYVIIYIFLVHFPIAIFIESKTSYKEYLFNDYFEILMVLFAPVCLFFMKQIKKYRINCYKNYRVKILIECNIYNEELKLLQRELKIKQIL